MHASCLAVSNLKAMTIFQNNLSIKQFHHIRRVQSFLESGYPQVTSSERGFRKREKLTYGLRKQSRRLLFACGTLAKHTYFLLANDSLPSGFAEALICKRSVNAVASRGLTGVAQFYSEARREKIY